MIDTTADSNHELQLAVYVLGQVLASRGTPKVESNVPAGTMFEEMTRAPDMVAHLADVEATLNPADVFGKDPLPADAIATDLPENFTQPAATSIAPPAPVVLTESAPPAPLTIPPNASPVTITAAATSSAPASQTTDGEDRDGFRWDVRIHASTKAKNQDGTWRVKRGVDPELVKAVRAEQRSQEIPAATIAGAVDVPAVNAAVDAAMQAATSPVAPTVQPAVAPPPPPLVASPDQPRVDATTPAASPAPPPPVTLVASTGITTAAELMALKITPAMNAKKIDGDMVVAKCKELQIAGLHSLFAPENAKHIPAIVAWVDSLQ